MTILITTFMMKTKGDFIIDLLSSKRLQVSDKERILKLSASELIINEKELQKIRQEVGDLKTNFETENKKLSTTIESAIETLATASKNNLDRTDLNKSQISKNDTEKSKNKIHTPRLTSKYLSLFKEDNEGNDIKYTTHLYKNRENDNFDYDRITKNSIKKFNTFATEIPKNLMGIINRYLRENLKKPEGNTITYLGKHYETWGSPRMKNWCAINPGKHPSTDEYLDSQIIEPFKKSIEFRKGKDFVEALNFKLKNTFATDQLNQLDIDYDGVLDSFRVFTAVDQLVTGVAQLFDPILRRIDVSSQVHVYTDLEERKVEDYEIYCRTIYIVHKGSNVPSNWDENIEIANGNLSSAKTEFTSLCDWQIIANFNNGTYRFSPLSIDSNSKVEKMNNIVDGFTHKLIFYP